MSTIKVNKIENTATADGGIAIDASGHVTVDGQQLPTAGPLSNRNLIINGAMQISQRADDFQPPADGDYTLDRFQAFQSSADAYDVQKVTDTPSGQGFKNSLKVTSNAATSIAAGGYYYLGQKIEGNNWVQMGYGASGAKTCTVSFWVKSSLTGTHSGILKNSDQTRSLAFEYTISSANTWEYKQITIAGDTGGTWLTGSGTGVWVYFSMGVGTTFATGTANTWQATNLVGTTGSVDLVETSGATWFMTGLQVEEGDKATPFEFRSFADELARCERYFELIKTDGEGFIGYSYHPTSATCPIRFRTKKRATPGTITLGTAGTGANQIAMLTSGGSYPSTVGGHSVNAKNSEGFRLSATSYAGLVDDGVSALYGNGDSLVAKVDAEL